MRLLQLPETEAAQEEFGNLFQHCILICLDQNIRLWDIDINGSEKIYFNIAHINTFN